MQVLPCISQMSLCNLLKWYALERILILFVIYQKVDGKHGLFHTHLIHTCLDSRAWSIQLILGMLCPKEFLHNQTHQTEDYTDTNSNPNVDAKTTSMTICVC